MKIDPSETFPRLPHPPIVEAILDLRCLPGPQWNQEILAPRFQANLPQYPHVEPQRGFFGQWSLPADRAPEHRWADLGWTGVLFRSADRLQVVQLRRQGFVFSRLAPYVGWESFEEEALRLWQVYVELARPTEIQRIGLRFINRMSCPREGFGLKDYLVGSPELPPSPPLRRDLFFHQDTFGVPESDYSVSLIRTLQPPQPSADRLSLILDIDVFAAIAGEPSEHLALRARLRDMRWLKNKIFFSMITPKARGLFQ